MSCAKTNCSKLSLAQKAISKCCNASEREKPVKKVVIDIPKGTGKCAGKTGQALVTCNAKQVVKGGITAASRDKKDKKQGGSGKTVPAGANKETIDSILGSPEDWANATKGTCMGIIPLPCEMAALAIGAVIVLILALKL